MQDFARVRRFLGLTQRDVSAATSILISRLSGAERGVIALTNTERVVLQTFLARRVRVAFEAQKAGCANRAPGVLVQFTGREDM
jgi:hypothetical protein